MEPRMKNPAAVIPGAWQAVVALNNADPVPDEISDEAARHFDEQGMASLMLKIAVTSVFNRLNKVTRQVAGAW